MTQDDNSFDSHVFDPRCTDENWLAYWDNPSEADAKWAIAHQEKVRQAGERLRERLSSVPFYAKRAAECKATEGSEAPYWESLVTGTYN